MRIEAMSSNATSSAGGLQRAERRWPVSFSIFVVLALLIALPDRVRLVPPWILYIVGTLVLVPTVMAGMLPRHIIWLRIERGVTFFFVAVAGVCNVGILAILIFEMIRRARITDGLHLLSSSIAIWATNVLMFSLLYWQLDRGGPAARASATPERPDWIFPAEQAPDGAVRLGWRPQFVDYLFLGFSTATAFSTTDALPLTGRAKMAMMIESTVSLVTLAVVAARAINILGA
jgi:hypothetical protein